MKLNPTLPLKVKIISGNTEAQLEKAINKWLKGKKLTYFVSQFSPNPQGGSECTCFISYQESE